MPSISGRVVRAMEEEPRNEWEARDNNNIRRDFTEGEHTGVLTQQYQNFVHTFWNSVRDGEARNRPRTILLSTTTTTTSEDEDEDEDLGEALPARFHQPNNVQANHDETTMENSDSSDSSSEESEGDYNTTTFTEDFHDNDTLESTTTTETSGMEYTLEELQRLPRPSCCPVVTCRNRPAVDCVNSLCGRCCVLIGNYHCPRHNC